MVFIALVVYLTEVISFIYIQKHNKGFIYMKTIFFFLATALFHFFLARLSFLSSHFRCLQCRRRLRRLSMSPPPIILAATFLLSSSGKFFLPTSFFVHFYLCFDSKPI